jgi:hypothetical protein
MFKQCVPVRTALEWFGILLILNELNLIICPFEIRFVTMHVISIQLLRITSTTMASNSSQESGGRGVVVAGVCIGR